MWFEKFIRELAIKLNIDIIYAENTPLCDDAEIKGFCSFPQLHGAIERPTIFIKRTEEDPWRYLFHELAHLTGAFLPDRYVLNRISYYSPSYRCAEETIAETVALKLMVLTGLSTIGIMQDQLDYLQSYKTDEDVTKEINAAVVYILDNWIDINVFRKTGKVA